MFMLANVGDKPKNCDAILTTLGYGGGKKPAYMFEGSVFNAGSAVQWLRDGLDFFKKSKDSEKLALSVDSTEGVYVVPAFTGLGSPYWRSDVSGLITGITRGTTKAHITRAVLEAMAYSARDLIEVMKLEGDLELSKLCVDGGASQNDFLMQFQSDITNKIVDRPVESESTALGAAYLCEIALGIRSVNEVASARKTQRLFTPDENREKYEKLYEGWQKAVKRCLV
jgi:glycerol kinase